MQISIIKSQNLLYLPPYYRRSKSSPVAPWGWSSLKSVIRIWTHFPDIHPINYSQQTISGKTPWKSTISPWPNPTCMTQVAPAGFPSPGRDRATVRQNVNPSPSPLAGRSTWGTFATSCRCWVKKIFQDCRYGTVDGSEIRLSCWDW